MEEHTAGTHHTLWVQMTAMAGELFGSEHPPGEDDGPEAILCRGQLSLELRAALGWLHLGLPMSG